MVVTISHRGYVKRCSPSLYKAQNRGGKGVMGSKKLREEDEDFISEIFVASTHSYILILTSKGKLHWLKVYQFPETDRTARGRAIVNMLRIDEDETVSAIVPVMEFEEGKYVVMVTKRGYVKRVDLMAFSNIRAGGIRATVLDENDELINVHQSDGTRDCLVSTKNGLAIRFSEQDVRSMGRVSRGVKAISLSEGDEVVSFSMIPSEPEPDMALLTVCENGYGKRTSVSEYKPQGRGGKGCIDIKTAGRNGPVIVTCRVSDTDEVMLITTSSKVIRIPVNNVSVIGRNTMGVRLINLEEGESVAAMAKIVDAQDNEDDNELNDNEVNEPEE